MKTIALTIILLGLASIANSEDITVSGIDLTKIVSVTRLGYALPLDGGKTLKDVYAPMLTLHNAAKTVEYAYLNIGAAAYTGSSKGYVIVFPSIRLDAVVDRFTGISKFTKDHITTVKLPKIDIGLGFMIFDGKLRKMCNLAMRF